VCLRAEHMKETPSLAEDERWQQAAEIYGINPQDAFRWRTHGEKLMSLETNREKKRVFRRKRDQDEPNRRVYAPATPHCLAPPRPPAAHALANELFRKIIDWYEEHHRDCSGALSILFNHMQRSKTQLKFPYTS